MCDYVTDVAVFFRVTYDKLRERGTTRSSLGRTRETSSGERKKDTKKIKKSC